MHETARVHFGVAHPWLCDSMGHLTSRHYVAMFDDASYHFFRMVFGYDAAAADWAGLGFADVRQVIEYKAEVSSGDLVHIDGEIGRLGEKSITARFTMRRSSDDTEVATLEATTVFFDLVARRARSLTDEMRQSGAKWMAPAS